MAQTQRDPANLSYGALIGATVTVVFITIITVWAELAPGLKTWLANTFTHHWVGKGVLAAAVFFIAGLFGASGQSRSDDDHARAANTTFVTTLFCLIGLTLFFFYRAFITK